MFEKDDLEEKQMLSVVNNVFEWRGAGAAVVPTSPHSPRHRSLKSERRLPPVTSLLAPRHRSLTVEDRPATREHRLAELQPPVLIESGSWRLLQPPSPPPPTSEKKGLFYCKCLYEFS
nr:hypothetical protein Iba_chr04cCG13450 [Ipomoea batatas]